MLAFYFGEPDLSRINSLTEANIAFLEEGLRRHLKRLHGKGGTSNPFDLKAK